MLLSDHVICEFIVQYSTLFVGIEAAKTKETVEYPLFRSNWN